MFARPVHFVLAAILVGQGSAQFGPRVDVVTGETYRCLKAADLDIDGDNDLIFCGGGQGVYKLMNLDGQGNFGPLDTLALVHFSAAMPMDLADVDGDQDLDVVVHVSNGPQVLWMANDGAGNFTPVQPLVGSGVPTAINTLRCADVVGSPLPEVVLSGGDHVRWYINDGGVFTMADSVQHGAGNFQLVLVGLGDVDQDGDVDHVAKGQGAFHVGINPGTGGPWTSVPLSGLTPSGYFYGMDLIDADGDTDLDLIDASWQVRWMENLVADSGLWSHGPEVVVDPLAPNEGAGWSAQLGCGPGASILWCHWAYGEPPYWSHYDDALGGFTAPVVTDLRPAGDGRLFFGDLNGDAREDVIITHNDTLSWYVNALPATGGSTAVLPPLDTICAWGLNGGYPLPDGLPSGGLWTGEYMDGPQPNVFWPASYGQGAGSYPMSYGAIDAQGCIASAFDTILVINGPTMVCLDPDLECPGAELRFLGSPSGGAWNAPTDADGRLNTDCALRPIFTDVVYTFTDVTGHPCPSDVSMTVNVLPCTPVAIGAVGAFCVDAPPQPVQVAVPAFGVAYFLQGVDSSTYDGGAYVTGWLSGSQGPGIWPVVAAAVGQGECPSTDTVLVEVWPLPAVTFDLGVDTLTECNVPLVLDAGVPLGGIHTINGGDSTYTVFEVAEWGQGTHTVTYTYSDGNGCTASATDTLVVSCSTALPAPDREQLQVWPVPASDEIHVLFTGRPQRGELLDALGRAVLTWPRSAAPVRIDLSHVQHGTYVVRLEDGRTQRVLVQ